jgi:hypothetical protein
MSGDEMTTASLGPAGVMTAARTERGSKQHEKSGVVGQRARPAAREGQAGPRRMAERPVVATKPGNSGGAKGPWFEGKRQKE